MSKEVRALSTGRTSSPVKGSERSWIFLSVSPIKFPTFPHWSTKWCPKKPSFHVYSLSPSHSPYSELRGIWRLEYAVAFMELQWVERHFLYMAEGEGTGFLEASVPSRKWPRRHELCFSLATHTGTSLDHWPFLDFRTWIILNLFVRRCAK